VHGEHIACQDDNGLDYQQLTEDKGKRRVFRRQDLPTRRQGVYESKEVEYQPLTEDGRKSRDVEQANNACK
jgi:hypothetical protein